MSDNKLNMDVDDYDLETFFREEDSDVEEGPAQALPQDGLESLVCAEAQIFSDSQLAEIVNEPSQVDPAPLSVAQQIVRDNMPGPILTIPDWDQEMREHEERLREEEDEEELLASDSEERQQDMGDRQELLPSDGEASVVEVSQDEVV